MEEQIGRYEIRRELGQGGMATVYLAYDPRFQRQVAIKVLPRQFTHDPKYLARFEQEARMIASLEHPAIVPVYDFGEHEDAPYLVMRYMSGGSLRDRLKGEPLTLSETAAVLDRLAPAVDHAHDLGIVHRDLKPENIFFDADGRPYLADFGIARLAEDSKTLTVVGTRAYMSPEQVEGDVNPDGRADIYALGVMLYELLTGKQPYEAETPTKQMMAHVLKPVPKILEDNPDLPPQTQAIIDKVMAKKRDDRYATTGDLAAAFSGLVGSDVSSVAEQNARKDTAKTMPSAVETSPVIVAPTPVPEENGTEEAAIDVPDEVPPDETRAPENTRNTAVKILIALTALAGILALIDALRYSSRIDFSALPGFGSIWHPAPELFTWIVSAGLGIIWFVAAYSLWSFNPSALNLVRVTAVINLIFMGGAIAEDVPIENMGWAIMVSILSFALSFLPNIKRAFAQQTTETAGSAEAPILAANKRFVDKLMRQSGLLPWWLVAVEGGLLILISLYLIIQPIYDSAELTWIFAFYWFISAVMNVIKIYFSRSMLGLKVVAGASGVVVGFFFIQYLKNGYIDPDQIIIIFLGIIIGAANLIQGLRGSGRGTLILGIASISIAVILLAARNDIIYSITPWTVALLSGIGGILAIRSSINMRNQRRSIMQ